MSKLRWRNFPLHLFKGVIEVAQFGEGKHGTYSFLENDDTVNDHLDALFRHFCDFIDDSKPDTDHETKKLQLYHVAWRALAAARVIETKPHLDDRYKGEENGKTTKFSESNTGVPYFESTLKDSSAYSATIKNPK